MLEGTALDKSTSRPGVTGRSERIILFGDSTTAPRGTVRIFAIPLEERLHAAGMPAQVINAGVPGNDTQQARERLPRDVLALQPTHMTVWFGINDSAVDVWDGKTEPQVSLDRYEQNLRFIVQQLRAHGVEPILMTPNPVAWTPELKKLYGKPPYKPDDPDGWNVLLKDYARTVRHVAADEKVSLVDVYRLFQEYARHPGNRLYDLTVDGMHPNDAGHRIIAEELFKVLMRLCTDVNCE